MLVNPYAGDWIFFGGFVGYALLSAIHQDRRIRVLGPEELSQFQAETSLIPFAAMVKGQQKIIWREFNRFGLLTALVLFAGLIGLRSYLFGGFG